MAEQEIGGVTHYYSKIGVAGIEVTSGTLEVGDRIHIVGHTSDFEETLESMQLEHESIEVATPGMSVGINVAEHAREHDKVFKVTG
jgi:translation elongation factor EF-1alpha